MEGKTVYIVGASYAKSCFEELYTYLLVADTEKDALDRTKAYHSSRNDIFQPRYGYSYTVKYAGIIPVEDQVIEIDYTYIDR